MNPLRRLSAWFFGESTAENIVCCSFCRKSYRNVGPLVEGPGRVYICGDCIELCGSILDQERARRGVVRGEHAAGSADPKC